MYTCMAAEKCSYHRRLIREAETEEQQQTCGIAWEKLYQSHISDTTRQELVQHLLYY